MVFYSKKDGKIPGKPFQTILEQPLEHNIEKWRFMMNINICIRVVVL